jgi:hypothetical protein
VGHIRQWHLNRGFNDIGYHKYVDRSGYAHNGRDLNVIGAHTQGHNQDSIGIAYEGRWFPSVAQIDYFLNAYRTYRDIYQINFKSWYGHYEFNSGKTCPGFDMDDFRKILMKIA